jgi:outer membrane murein-binding lipoprotein Lpp
VISLRYHVVSIAAVFLALAIGIVLGSTTLSNALLSGLSGQRDQLAAQVSDLQSTRDRLNSQLSEADRFATAVGPAAVRGQLTGRTVVLVSAAGASSTDRDALATLLGAAGASVTGEVQLTDGFVDPNRADQLRDLVTRMIPAGAQLPLASDPGTLAGGMFGDLLLLNKTTGNSQATPDERAAAMSGLAAGGFIDSPTQPVLPAQLVIVLTGGGQSSNDPADRAATVARFAVQMQRGGAGAVLAGGAGSADGTGAIGVVRADPSAGSVLSTVDDADTATGRIGTVLALRQQLDGKAGSYGTAGTATAPAPETSAS